MEDGIVRLHFGQFYQSYGGTYDWDGHFAEEGFDDAYLAG